MPYNSIVLVKQVPDTKNITGKAMKDDGTVNRAALPAIFNPEDLNALEMALEIKDRYGGEVTVLTMGPPSAAEVLRQSLYRGADKVALLTDIKFARADTLATSYALSCAVQKCGDFDLVFCGRQAIDGDTAQVGPQTAEKLGLPQICYVEEIKSIENGQITARRSIEGGYEVIEAKLPILLTVTGEANVPRPPRAKLLMQYKRAMTPMEVKALLTQQMQAEAGDDGANGKAGAKVDEAALNDACEKKIEELKAKGLFIPIWNIESIGADPARCGGAGSPTMVREIENIVLTASGFKEIEPTEEGIADLVRELVEDHTLE